MTTDVTLAALEKHHAEAAAAYADAAAAVKAASLAYNAAKRALDKTRQRAWDAGTKLTEADHAIDAYKDPIGTAAADKFFGIF